MNIIFSWLEQDGVKNVIDFIYNILKVIRIVVPIGLIVMTTLDITKKVINPNEKDGQKKIMYRAIAALIVFFVPTLIKLVFNIGGIKEETLDNQTNQNTNDSELNKVNITNCPSTNQSFRDGDRLVLNTNIPSNYSNNVIWSVTDRNVVVTPTNNNLSVNIDIGSLKYDTTAIIQVVANGKSDTCIINLETYKLDDVSILNCDRFKRYIVGDLVSLNTSIPSNFKGNVEWETSRENIMVVKDSTRKDKIVYEIIKRPETGYSIITVTAGGKKDTCMIDIASVKKLELNCPSGTYHVGDTIHLKTNLPTSYDGTIDWNNGSSSLNVFNIKRINNGLEAELEIINKPQYGSGYIYVLADNDSANCIIKIE